jgi:hypothetical protein
MHLSSHLVTSVVSSPAASGGGRDDLTAQHDYYLATPKKCYAADRTVANLVLLDRWLVSNSSARMADSASVAKPVFDQVFPLLLGMVRAHCGVSVAVVDGLLEPCRDPHPLGGHCLRHGSYLFACSCPGSGGASEGPQARHQI